MLNMIKLDWLGMKCYWVRIIVVPIVIAVYGLLSEILIIPFIAFMMMSFSVNPFAVEEKGKLDNLYLTLPITRKTIVDTRYCLSLLMQLIGFIFGVTTTVILAAVLNGKHVILYTHTFMADFQTVSLLVCSSLMLYAVMNLATFPTLFKIGYAKGKALGFYIPIVVITVLLFVFYMMSYLNDGFHKWLMSTVEWSYNSPLIVCALMIIGAAILLIVSYLLSRLFYSKRDL